MGTELLLIDRAHLGAFSRPIAHVAAVPGTAAPVPVRGNLAAAGSSAEVVAVCCTSLGEEHLARLVWVRGHLGTRGVAHRGLQGVFCHSSPHLRTSPSLCWFPALNVLRLCFSPGSWGGRSEGWLLCSSSRTKLQAAVAAPAAGSVLSPVPRACLLLLSGTELLMQPSWTHWPC